MTLRSFLLVMLWLLVVSATGAVRAADEVEEVNRLRQAGQTAEALQRADRWITANPRDAQMRFLKALLLTDDSRPAEAITVLEKLTEDYPDLAEPYNNLALLHAAAGDYAKARAALEQALRLRPSYATAQENLGDVYAALAGQAYAEALRLAPARSAIAAKLALMRQLTTPSNASVTAPAASTPAKPH